MSLSSTLKPLFDSGDRNRGSSYHKRGSVFSMKVNDGLLVAEVDGSYGFYEVTLDVEDFENEEALSCTCPRFDDGFYCKHIWATILKYESVYGVATSKRACGNARNAQRNGSSRKKSKRKSTPAWQSLLQRVAIEDLDSRRDSTSPFQVAASQQSEIHYVIDASEGSRYEPTTIQLSVMKRDRKVNGEWGKLKPFELSHHSVDKLPDPTNQKIAAQLMGADRKYTSPYGYGMVRNSFSKFEFDSSWSTELCELLVASGRLHWTLGMDVPLEDFLPIEYIDFKTPAEICVQIQEKEKPKNSALMEVAIMQNGSQLNNEDIVKIADDGIALLRNGLVCISNPGVVELWTEAKNSPHIEIAKKDRNDFLAQLSGINGLPHLEIPNSWQVQQPETIEPTGVLQLQNHHRRDNELSGEIVFAYGETEFPLTSTQTVVFDANENTWSKRDLEAESKLIQQITAFPIADTTHDPYAEHDFRLNKKHLVRIVDELGAKGWKIQWLCKPISAAEFASSPL